jgi:alpha-beta hydrolase superfamily lysophospholipase
MTSRQIWHQRCGVFALAIVAAAAAAARAEPQRTMTLRGQEQFLHLSGPAGGQPVIVSSGDGGWIHLGPHVADLLAARGCFVVGFDAKAYLTGFTGEHSALRLSDEPRDYKMLAAFASAATGRKPVLIGVSEGAGLSVLAASDPDTKAAIGGVIAIGLPDVNELGWRWKDSLTYLTHHPPNEPAFSAAGVVGGVAPLPLALVQSTHDEFVPVSDTRRIFDSAASPKQLWLIEASNHRFSSNLTEFDARLLEALEWVRRFQSR